MTLQLYCEYGTSIEASVQAPMVVWLKLMTILLEACGCAASTHWKDKGQNGVIIEAF